MSLGLRAAVATWYSSGWNRWWLRRSTRVTRTGALRSARAAARPAKPPPRITTCGAGAVLISQLASSVPVVPRLERPFGGNAQVVGLLLRELGQLRAEVAEVQPRHALVEVL